MVQFTDLLTIDKAHRTKDGYLRVTAKGARSGIQTYLGSEVDPEGKRFKADDTVNVYRPHEEVFARDTLASFVGRPITDDHPSVAVTSKNWRDLSRGVIGGTVAEGEWVRFDLAFMDAGLIDKIDAGKRELSCGYDCDLTFEDGVALDGTPYQAVQRKIAGNHIAVVDRARAGPEAAIRDGGNAKFAACDSVAVIHPLSEDREPTKMPHTLTIDGLQVPNVSDEAKAAIEKLQGQVKDERDGRAADKATHDKALATKDAEIDDLKAKVVDQAKIDELADAKAAVVAKAKTLCGDKLGDTGGKSVADVRRMACAAKLGDTAVKDKSDDYIEARFDTLTADAKVEDTVHNIGVPKPLADAAAVRDLARAAQY